MKKTGLDGRHRDQDGEIQQKRSDTLNKIYRNPFLNFLSDTTLGEMRKRRRVKSARNRCETSRS